MKLTVCLLKIEVVLLILLLASTYARFLLSAFVMTVIAKNWTALLFVNYCLMLNFSKPKKQQVSSPSVPRISWLQICGEDLFFCVLFRRCWISVQSIFQRLRTLQDMTVRWIHEVRIFSWISVLDWGEV